MGVLFVQDKLLGANAVEFLGLDRSQFEPLEEEEEEERRPVKQPRVAA